MAVGVSGFKNDRLIQARKARGLTAISLAEMTSVSQSAISLYEKGIQNPRQKVMDTLALVLNVPPPFFLKDIDISKPDGIFYRSMSSATKIARERAESRYWLILEIIDYLLEYFDFPEVNMPSFNLPEDFRSIRAEEIESLAEHVRENWGLGDAPISNMVGLLERNGIVVWGTYLGVDTLEAFSEPKRKPHPVITLSSDKRNYFRARFDAAHELGHLILHNDIDKKSLSKKADFKTIEQQAHLFASAFLLPEASYAKDLWSVSIDAFRALKPRWMASITLQIMRAKQLGLVDEDQGKRLWINLSRRGWRRNEPLDDSTEPEAPSLIQKSISILINENVQTAEQIAQKIGLHLHDIERFTNVTPGTLTGNIPSGPRLKPHRDGNVVQFERRG